MIFWILFVVLLAVAIAWLAPVLWKEHRLIELDRKQQNIKIAKERLDEIAAEHATGAMTDEVFAQARDELEASLIEDVSQQDADTGKEISGSNRLGRTTWIILALLIPLSTIMLYQSWGSPQYLEFAGGNAGRGANVAQGHADNVPASMAELIDQLKQRLEENPDDGDGWYLLSRSYMAESRYAEALEALDKTYEIYGDHPAILIGMADAEAMIRQGDLTGRPSDRIEKALQLDPENTTGLWLGGMAAHQNGNFQQAVDRWTTLLPILAQEPQSQQEVRELISQAVAAARASGVEVTFNEPVEVAAAMPQEQPAGEAQMDNLPEIDAAPSIKAWVSIDKSIADKVVASDTVFVFAKAKAGPPMPLAAFKTTVDQLPTEVTLDDSMAMMPQMKLSLFDEVVVSARVSKSGQPGVMPGDLTSAPASVKLEGVVGVQLTISEVVE